MIAYRTHIAYPPQCQNASSHHPETSAPKRKRQTSQISAEVRAAILDCMGLERACETADRFKVSRNIVIGINGRARRKAQKAAQ